MNVKKQILVYVLLVSLILCAIGLCNNSDDKFRFNSKAEFSYHYLGKMTASTIYLTSHCANGRLIIQNKNNDSILSEHEFIISEEHEKLKYLNEVYQTYTIIKYLPSKEAENNGFIKLKIKHR